MLDWEGNMANKRDRKEHTLDLNVAVDLPIWENEIDKTVIAAFDATDEWESNESNVDDFIDAINHRTVASKYAMSIGSVSAHVDGSSNLYEPTTLNISNDTRGIHSLEASKHTTITPEFLSKVWHIKVGQAKKTLNQTTQLY